MTPYSAGKESKLSGIPPEPREFRYSRPRNSEETVSAIYEELSVIPYNEPLVRDSTVKGDIHKILEHLLAVDRAATRKEKDRSFSHSFSLGLCAALGMGLLLFTKQKLDGPSWWISNTYFLFCCGAVLTFMFILAAMERSQFVANLLQYNSVKLLCAFIFSAAVVYSSAQASSLLNSIFGIDGSNFPFARTILSGVYFLKISSPFLLVVALFALVHIMTIWGRDSKGDIEALPWASILFLLASVMGIAIYWSVTHTAFGETEIKQKAYKLAHYLDFNDSAYCAQPAKDGDTYIFFGNDQNKILIDRKLPFDESFEDFMKGTSILGKVEVPTTFEVRQCQPIATR